MITIGIKEVVVNKKIEIDEDNIWKEIILTKKRNY